MEGRAKLCISYIITALLITLFVYSLQRKNVYLVNKVEQLQDDMEEIMKVIYGRSSDEAVIQRESFVKKHAQEFWDELRKIKKKLESIEGATTHLCGFNKRPDKHIEILSKEEPNYALESVGAAVINVQDEPYHPTDFILKLLGLKHKANHPGSMLDPSMQLGHCYAFKGQKTSFVIKLVHKINMQSMAVEHISKSASLNGDISNAPKDFLVYGLENLEKDKGTFLGAFQYNNTMIKRAQTFHFASDSSYNFYKISVTSNYGNPNQTCIYRIAIHGILSFD